MPKASLSKKQDLDDRLKRANSWIAAAQALHADQMHAAFVFLYIAFNALYGQRRYEGGKDEVRKDRGEFLSRVRVMHSCDLRYGSGILIKSLNACRQQAVSLIRNIYLRDTYWNKTQTKKQRGRESFQGMRRTLRQPSGYVDPNGLL
jgi:hypothetical protein